MTERTHTVISNRPASGGEREKSQFLDFSIAASRLLSKSLKNLKCQFEFCPKGKVSRTRFYMIPNQGPPPSVFYVPLSFRTDLPKAGSVRNLNMVQVFTKPRATPSVFYAPLSFRTDLPKAGSVRNLNTIQVFTKPRGGPRLFYAKSHSSITSTQLP